MNIALEPATLAERIDRLETRIRDLETERTIDAEDVLVTVPYCDDGCGCTTTIPLTVILARLNERTTT